MKKDFNLLHNLQHDLPAGLVVFLVALPLCLGIALASGAPLLSGIIAGITGGIIVGLISNSSVSVSGPAAGLTIIVLNSIEQLGSYQAFIMAVVIAGVLQFILGVMRAGSIGNYFPNSVIKGMLTAIGLILILKQIPHGLGYDTDFEGDETFVQPDGHNTFTELLDTFGNMSWVITCLTILSIITLMIFESESIKKYRWSTYIPGPLIVVIAGVVLQIQLKGTPFEIKDSHLVGLPEISSIQSFITSMTFPDFSKLGSSEVWIIAITLCVVASLESLLSIDAIDKIDPFKRITNLNQELKAQGIGNFVSGLLGGLPITSVIVRSSANVTSGGRTKLSTVFHGFLILICSLSIPNILNKIPLASLAAILLLVGYKLAKPSIFSTMYKKGKGQFIPFMVTCFAIIFTDLLTGIFIGMITGIFFVLKTNFHEAIMLVKDGNNYLLRLTKDVSFINKKALRDKLLSIPDGSYVIIDGASSQFIDYDITETLSDFIENSNTRDIVVEVKKTNTAANKFFKK